MKITKLIRAAPLAIGDRVYLYKKRRLRLSEYRVVSIDRTTIILRNQATHTTAEFDINDINHIHTVTHWDHKHYYITVSRYNLFQFDKEIQS